MSCYAHCKSYGFPDCPDVIASCEAAVGYPAAKVINCENFDVVSHAIDIDCTVFGTKL